MHSQLCPLTHRSRAANGCVFHTQEFIGWCSCFTAKMHRLLRHRGQPTSPPSLPPLALTATAPGHAASARSYAQSDEFWDAVVDESTGSPTVSSSHLAEAFFQKEKSVTALAHSPTHPPTLTQPRSHPTTHSPAHSLQLSHVHSSHSPTTPPIHSHAHSHSLQLSHTSHHTHRPHTHPLSLTRTLTPTQTRGRTAPHQIHSRLPTLWPTHSHTHTRTV